MLSLRYALPALDLRGHFSSYYLFRADLPKVFDTTRADLPQMRFMLIGSGFYTFGNGRQINCPDAMITGPTMSATRFMADGPLLVFGVGVLPAGWTAMVGSSAAELSDSVEDANGVLGPVAGQMLDWLRDARSFETMCARMDIVLRLLVDRPRDQPLRWFTQVADSWLMGEASPRIDDLMHETGLSARQLERLANRLYGAPPKLLARKYRTLRIASRVAMQDNSWQDLVDDAFYDQSHLIRDFKRFTGQTPRQLLLNPSPVTKLMIARRRIGSGMPLLALES